MVAYWCAHLATAQCRLDNTAASILTTNPANTNWPSPPYDQPYKKNTGSNLFDWRQQWFNVQMPNTAYTGYSQLLSPFWQTSSSDHLWNIIGFGLETPGKADFQPADGWELIKRDFGVKADGSVNNSQARVGPYFILYNRFSGTLRVIGYLPAGDGGFPVINVRLSLANDGGNKPTGLFAYYNRDADIATTVARPMDQTTSVASIVTPAKLGAAANIPFFADFQLAYDPCTCNFASALEVSFEKVQTMKVDLYGKILGTTQPISTFNSQNGVAQYKDYLTSVYANQTGDYKINAGMITYSNVQKMYDDYQTSAARAGDYAGLSLGLDILKTALDLGGVGINTFFDEDDIYADRNKSYKNGFDAAGILSSFSVPVWVMREKMLCQRWLPGRWLW